jgi:hypothetical protein
MRERPAAKEGERLAGRNRAPRRVGSMLAAGRALRSTQTGEMVREPTAVDGRGARTAVGDTHCARENLTSWFAGGENRRPAAGKGGTWAATPM